MNSIYSCLYIACICKIIQKCKETEEYNIRMFKNMYYYLDYTNIIMIIINKSSINNYLLYSNSP